MTPAGPDWKLCLVLATAAAGHAGCAPAPPAAPPPSNLDVYVPPSVPSWPDEPPPDEPEADEPAADAEDGFGSAAGVWEGEGVQNDGQRWPTVVQVETAQVGRCASVVYPSRPEFPIECVGDWLCEEGTTDHRLVGTERILEGESRCIDGCRFDANLDTGFVQYDCADHGVIARAQLTRIR